VSLVHDLVGRGMRSVCYVIKKLARQELLVGLSGYPPACSTDAKRFSQLGTQYCITPTSPENGCTLKNRHFVSRRTSPEVEATATILYCPLTSPHVHIVHNRAIHKKSGGGRHNQGFPKLVAIIKGIAATAAIKTSTKIATPRTVSPRPLACLPMIFLSIAIRRIG
jgi:hypothetical protein